MRIALAATVVAACHATPAPKPTMQPAPIDAAPDAPTVVVPDATVATVTPDAAADPFAARVVADFERAVLESRAAYAALFDYAAVGEIEILLHRYDLVVRMPDLAADLKKQFAAEDGTPYPAARERKNVGSFYSILAQRTVGTGGCTVGPPRSAYTKHLYDVFEPLPLGTPPKYETLRTHANAWLAAGDAVSFTCRGGTEGLTVVYTKRDTARGYDLVTIYDDTP